MRELWAREDILRRVHKSLDVVEAVTAEILDAPERIDLASLEAPTDKVTAETASLLAVIARVPFATDPELHRRVSDLVERLLPHVRSSRVSVGIALNPALALDYGAGHLVLSEAGWPDPSFDRVLADALTASTHSARERLPHREVEQAWLRGLAGKDVPVRPLAERTAMARGVDLLAGTRDDMYALTHALLYATDFGAVSPPPCSRSPETIAAEADSALVGALDDDDFDLAGELLLTRLLFGLRWSTTAAFSFSVLAAAEDSAGLLPSLSTDSATYQTQSPEARRQYATATAYHTAYVMGLGCALMLTKDRLPPVSPFQATHLDPGELNTLRMVEEHLKAQTKKVQWEVVFGRLSAGDQVALSPFVLDAALRRAARRLDFVSVRQLLELSAQRRSTAGPTPLAMQAAELVYRLARLPAMGRAIATEGASGG